MRINFFNWVKELEARVDRLENRMETRLERMEHELFNTKEESPKVAVEVLVKNPVADAGAQTKEAK